MHRETKKIAVCGVMGALAVAIMLLGGILPLATFLAPAIAGMLIMPVAIEYGSKSGILLYITISLLSFLTAADKEMALIFIFFLGYYPLLKTFLERIKSRVIKIAVKFAVFNAAVCSMYALLLLIFPAAEFMKDFGGSFVFVAALLIMANVTFVIYDIAVARLVGLYCVTLRDKLMK